MTVTDPPRFIAYALKREGRISHWLEVGVASMHADGSGFDVILDRLPVGGFNGHISVRASEANPVPVDNLGPARPSE